MKRYKILYIDDQKINLLLFTEVFKDEYFIFEATSGAEGLEILKSEHVDLIISDQAMPQMTGVEFFEKALLIDPGPNRILLTAFKDLNALAEAINRAKIFRYVNKPWNKVDLQNIMDSAIQEYQLRIKNEQLTERLKFHTTKLRESVNLKNQLLADLEISKSELEESEMKLRRIIELSPLPIAISDLNNVNLVLNNQFIETFGYTLEDIPTINEWYIRAYPDIEYRENHISLWKNQMALLIKNKKVIEALESIVVCKNGDKKAIQIKASIIGENQVAIFNDLTKIRHLEEDISFRIIMEEEIMRAKVAAESANKAKSEFIASMSHEIRTPMNAILGYAEVLSNELKEPIQMDYVKSIQSSGKTLLSLINDILDFSRIEAGKIELHKDAVNIRNLIQDIADIFKFKIKEKKLEFITHVCIDLPKFFIVDELRVKQILMNLVSNSLKFTHQGFIKINVDISNSNNNYVDLIISVEDSGIGIAKDQQEKVFRVFEQTEGQDSKKYGGTGLGLAITSNLAKIMNGDISLTSEIGKGSKFIVKLENVETTNSEIQGKSNTELLKEITFTDKVKILIVDDLEENRKIIRLNLVKFNFEIFEAANGYEALDIFKKNTPDLVFMDLLMPELDGYETFKKIQQNSEWEKIPVIAITAYTLNNEKEQVLNMGFAGYLSKPINFPNLKSMLIKYLSYKIKDKAPETKDSNEELLQIKPEKLTEIIADIDIKIIPLISQLETIRPKRIVSELGQELKQIGEKYNYTVLITYGNDILNAVKSFNVEKEKDIIEKFKILYKNLKT
ncbi:MAG: hypothetical protein A2041_09495 [Bacteroidetes bacterium GWA2_31_9b]|nr:MAG: hypothetical protein A2041_09495 [Bacteroidetes bacterium GWA2_31_9b]